VNVRPFTFDDAPAVAALVRADDEAFRGRSLHVDSTEVLARWDPRLVRAEAERH